MQKICVIGMGYIGLPTACILANTGLEVLGVDINEKIINKLNSGEPHIEEPELKEVFVKALKSKKLKISKKPDHADVFIISVPTPLSGENKADLSHVIEATGAVCECIKKGDLVILESTSPPLTTENLVGSIIRQKTGLKAGEDYYLAFCPERVLPGNLIFEFVNNDRVIGGINEESAEKARAVYARFTKGRIFLTDLKTAEFVKLAENTFRDVNIALSNELALICEDYGIDIWKVVELANKHPRVNILKPGPGVGGHCIPIDPWFILNDTGRKDTIIEKARYINDEKPVLVADRIISLTRNIDDPKIALFGAAYKEDIGDSRESPAVKIYRILDEKGLVVKIFDPHVKEFRYSLSSMDESIKGADMIVILVGHKLFKEIDYSSAYKEMRNKLILDTRNFLDGKKLKAIGYKYYRI